MSEAAQNPMLVLNGLSAGYTTVPVLKEISLTVGKGEFVAVLGPNGAGKTTLFKTISGLLRPSAGTLQFCDNDLLKVPAAQRPHLGIAHVPEGRQVFPSLSVLENLQMGAWTTLGRVHWQQNLEKVFNWFPALKSRQQQLAGTLSGGEQQMLALARALMSQPLLLMLDEPSMGLAPAIADEIFERLVEIHRNTGLTILLVEQRVAEALHYADRAYVLETGRIVLEGNQATLQANDRVRQAYLGL